MADQYNSNYTPENFIPQDYFPGLDGGDVLLSGTVSVVFTAVGTLSIERAEEGHSAAVAEAQRVERLRKNNEEITIITHCLLEVIESWHH